MMRQGEVWLVDFAPKIGQEIGKVRPAIIVNHDAVGVLKLKIVVPVTDSLKNPKEWLIPVVPNPSNGLFKPSVVDCFQVKSISEQRFIRKVGVLTTKEANAVKIGLIKVLGLI